MQPWRQKQGLTLEIYQVLNSDKPTQIIGWGEIPQKLQIPQEIYKTNIDLVACGQQHSIFSACKSLIQKMELWSLALDLIIMDNVEGIKDKILMNQYQQRGYFRMQTWMERVVKQKQSIFLVDLSFLWYYVKLQIQRKMSYLHLGTKSEVELLISYINLSQQCFNLRKSHQKFLLGLIELLCQQKIIKFIFEEKCLMEAEQQQVDKVSFGRRHCVFLNKEGKVYSWGDSTYGETGLGTTSFVKSPNLLTYLPERIVNIACGARHTLCLSSEGDIYSFGDNSDGQCGLEVSRICTPAILFQHTQEIKAQFIFAGESHCAMITNSGEAYM